MWVCFASRVITTILSFPLCPTAPNFAPRVDFGPRLFKTHASDNIPTNGAGSMVHFAFIFGSFLRPFVDASLILIRCRISTY